VVFHLAPGGGHDPLHDRARIVLSALKWLGVPPGYMLDAMPYLTFGIVLYSGYEACRRFSASTTSAFWEDIPVNKTIATAAEAAARVKDGSTILLGGFGVCGLPETSSRFARQRRQGSHPRLQQRRLDDFGIGTLLRAGRVRKMIMSYGGECKAFEEMTLTKQIEVEWNPQGTLAERLRAGGAGIGGFFTPTGYGTPVAEGKETRLIDGRWMVFEKP